jgi:hypothetical protein
VIVQGVPLNPTTIYANATNVIVWLGEEARESDMAMTLVEQFEKNGSSLRWIQDTQLNPSYAELYSALVKLHLRKYWTRLWIVQEIAFAKNAIVYCGTKSIKYSSLLEFHECSLKAFTEILASGEPSIAVNGERIMVNSAISQFYFYQRVFDSWGPSKLPRPGEARTGSKLSFLSALRNHRKQHCTDPRDKIFGLIGVADLSPIPQERLHVDYFKSTCEVYIEAAQAIIKQTGQLEVLCDSKPGTPLMGKAYNAQTGLPSWVPDWSIYPASALLQSRVSYMAAGTRPAFVKFSRNNACLTVKGFCIGSVATATFMCPTGVLTSPKDFEDQRSYLGKWLHFILHNSTFWKNHTQTETTFFRTLLACTFNAGPDPEAESILKEWIGEWDDMTKSQGFRFEGCHQILLSEIQKMTRPPPLYILPGPNSSRTSSAHQLKISNALRRVLDGTWPQYPSTM